MNNLHYGFMWVISMLHTRTGQNLKNLLKMLKKCCFGGQDDVKGPTWWKILGGNLFQHNLWSIVNNLHYGFMG